VFWFQDIVVNEAIVDFSKGRSGAIHHLLGVVEAINMAY